MNIFQTHYIDTYETIFPIVVAIDVSRSMVKYVQQINEVLQSLKNCLSEDAVLETADISVVIFSKGVESVERPVSGDEFKVPNLFFSQEVATTRGIYAATDTLKSRLTCFKKHKALYHWPRLFLLTNSFFDEQSIKELLQLKYHLYCLKKQYHLYFFPVCFSNSRKEILSSISIDIPPLNYLELNFDQCFRTIEEDEFYDRGLIIDELNNKKLKRFSYGKK